MSGPTEAAALPPRTRKQSHHTQWAGQFAVAAELAKRRYEVAFTMGNHTPLADLMCISPEKTAFLIDVKAMEKPNFWLIRQRAEVRHDLYYAFVLINQTVPTRIFIASHADVHRLVEEYVAVNERRKGYPGVNWSTVHPFENMWDRLPA